VKSLFTRKIVPEDYKILCHELYSAESEVEVIDVLKSHSLWDDENCWTNYGNEDNNVAIIGNQTTSPEAALVEKFTNSIDAILMKEARLHNIDPKSKDAPQSIDEAMELFYGKNHESINDEIFMVATGSQKRPSLAIIDKGEGQTPSQLSKTILSLRQTNKIEIKFVQGQFNQGGTAVLPFCGINRFQLVISKRHPDIADKSNTDHNKWGFTIVRRNSSDISSRNTRYEYLSINNEIPSFESEYLELLPAKYPSARSEKLFSGTYIKLYEYNISISSHINTSLNYHLSLLLPGAKIPINLIERREWDMKKRKTSNSMSARMYGHFKRFKKSQKNLEKGFPFKFPMEVQGEKLEVMIVCFKHKLHRSYKNTQGILFTLNGQTQGILKDTFFDRKRVGLGYLKDSLIVFIDATKLSVKSREDLFMSNRQHLRNNSFKREIERLLEDELSKNKMLQKLQKKRRNELMKERVNNTEGMQNTLSKLMKTSPNLNMLFSTGKDFEDRLNRSEQGDNLFSFNAQQYPSFFEYKLKGIKESPINRNFRIKFKTDVEDTYFTRDTGRGIASFRLEGLEVQSYTLTLKDGDAHFTCVLREDVKVGETLTYNYHISNENPDIETFSGSFEVLVTQEVNKCDKVLQEKKPKKEQDALSLPKIAEVYKVDWESYGFTAEDVLKINSNANSYDFIINMDNRYLTLEKKSDRVDELRSNEIFKGAIFLYALSLLNDKKDDDLAKVEISAKSYAKVVLPIFHYGEIYKD